MPLTTESCVMCSASVAAKCRRVFLAEDCGPVRARIAQMLARSSSIVGEADTARGCIAGILQTRPDVVVLDVQLKDGQGLEVLSAVRAADPAINFVVFSNIGLPAYRKRYLLAGAAHFLDKSTEFDQLAAVIHALPARSVAGQPNRKGHRHEYRRS